MNSTKPPLSPLEPDVLRFSLVFVWLATAVVSVWELDGQSLALLAAGGIEHPTWRVVLTLAGAGTDLAIGLMLWFAPRRSAYVLAFAMMLVMTVAATLLVPALWLHPLGPLTKNIPLAAMLWVLARGSR